MPRLGQSDSVTGRGGSPRRPAASAYANPSFGRFNFGNILMLLSLTFILRNLFFHDYRTEEINQLKASGKSADEINQYIQPKAEERKQTAAQRLTEYQTLKADVARLKDQVAELHARMDVAADSAALDMAIVPGEPKIPANVEAVGAMVEEEIEEGVVDTQEVDIRGVRRRQMELAEATQPDAEIKQRVPAVHVRRRKVELEEDTQEATEEEEEVLEVVEQDEVEEIAEEPDEILEEEEEGVDGEETQEEADPATDLEEEQSQEMPEARTVVDAEVSRERPIKTVLKRLEPLKKPTMLKTATGGGLPSPRKSTVAKRKKTPTRNVISPQDPGVIAKKKKKAVTKTTTGVKKSSTTDGAAGATTARKVVKKKKAKKKVTGVIQ